VTRETFVTRWRVRQDELARLGAQVDGARLCGEVLGDVEELFRSEERERSPSTLLRSPGETPMPERRSDAKPTHSRSQEHRHITVPTQRSGILGRVTAVRTRAMVRP
jgi:hypothetical protein